MTRPPAPGPSLDAGTDGPTRPAFGLRLQRAVAEHGPLCLGLDPHPDLLARWGLPDDPDGLERLCDAVLEAVAGRVAVLKPQSAFFERHGSRGIAVLENVLAALRGSGTLSLLDVKRGDVGSTMGAYAQAYLGEGAPLAADAVTLNPYLGVGALDPAFDLALANGRGVFVLALTSNPEGAQVQHVGLPSVAGRVVAEVAARNAAVPGPGSFGLVVGATVGPAPRRLGLGLDRLGGPVLAPGVGAQGATAADAVRAVGHPGGPVLPTVSRAFLQAGPVVTDLRAAAGRWAATVPEPWVGIGGPSR